MRAPLYKLLKKSDSFHWMQKALDDLKALISKPLILASSEPDGTLLLYIVATTQVISVALVVEREQPGAGVNYPRYRGPSVTAQNSWTRPISFSGIWLGGHTPRTRGRPYL
jgi:hypothetical protein